MNQETPQQASVPLEPPAKRRRRIDWRIAAALLPVLLAIPVWRATTGHAKARASTVQLSAVAVAKVTRENLAEELMCDSELRPYQEIDLHAKVAGFLEKINVDIG